MNYTFLLKGERISRNPGVNSTNENHLMESHPWHSNSGFCNRLFRVEKVSMRLEVKNQDNVLCTRCTKDCGPQKCSGNCKCMPVFKPAPKVVFFLKIVPSSFLKFLHGKNPANQQCKKLSHTVVSLFNNYLISFSSCP